MTQQNFQMRKKKTFLLTIWKEIRMTSLLVKSERSNNVREKTKKINYHSTIDKKSKMEVTQKKIDQRMIIQKFFSLLI